MSSEIEISGSWHIKEECTIRIKKVRLDVDIKHGEDAERIFNTFYNNIPAGTFDALLEMMCKTKPVLSLVQ